MRHRPGASLPASLLVRVPPFGAFALVALLAPFAPAQVVRERVSVEVITVTVAARDSAGRPVRDLRAADLELVRKDRSGHVMESVRRWVNKPGVEAEVRASGRCDGKTSLCQFTMTWAHPARLDPALLTVALDGVTVARKVTPIVRVPFPRGSTPQVVTADATFPDGRRATFTRLLQGLYPEKAEASLQAVPIAVQPGVPEEEIAALLRQAGWPVRAVEQGDFEIAFVVEPGAFGSSTNAGAAALGSHAGAPLGDAEQIRVVVANDSLAAFNAFQTETLFPAQPRPGVETGGPMRLERRPRGSGQASWLRHLFLAPLNAPVLKRLRTSDAVAIAGYDLGGSPRRRGVVLIAGSVRTDESTFSAEQALAYLGQTFVPLFVWRAAAESAPGWPEGSPLRLLGPDMAELRRDLDNQRIVWLEGHMDPRQFHPRLPPGITIAGRGEPDYAATAGSGVFKSTDRGQSWKLAGRELERTVVRCVATDTAHGESVYAGTDGGVFVSADRGKTWQRRSSGLPRAVVYALAVDPVDPDRLFAGTAAGLFESRDGARTWNRMTGSDPDAQVTSLALDSSKRRLYAGTLGRGVLVLGTR